MNLQKFSRYAQNLGYRPATHASPELRVYSYGTHVATQKEEALVELAYYSVTTRKHVNYAAQQLGLTLVPYTA